MAPYFVMSSHNDQRGVAITMGLPPAMPFYQHLLAGTPTVIVVINSILAGVIGSDRGFPRYESIGDCRHRRTDWIPHLGRPSSMSGDQGH